MNETINTLKQLVPKHCRNVNGNLKGGFINWESEEGKAVNKALISIALLEELKELGLCNNYQQERKDLVDWIDSVNKIIKDAKEVLKKNE